jgi:hypothetical protein
MDFHVTRKKIPVPVEPDEEVYESDGLLKSQAKSIYPGAFCPLFVLSGICATFCIFTLVVARFFTG